MIHKNQTQIPNNITAQMNFIFRARLLWRDLATWLRAYMLSLYGGVGNTDAISRRLYELPSEYGNIFRVFFGDQPTEQLINLITQYIAILQSLLVAQQNNDVNAINNLTQQLYANTNARAEFFASVNPYWLKSDWLTLLDSFSNMQIQESTTLLMKEYDRSIDIFDRALSLSTIMGDYLSDGLINFFALQQQRQPAI